MKRFNFLLALFSLLFVSTLIAGKVQAQTAVIVSQEDVKIDPQVYQRILQAYNNYIQWASSQNLSPLCNPTQNFSGRIDDVRVGLSHRNAVTSTAANPRHYQLLKNTPSFTYYQPFQPAADGDCYLSVAQAIQERDKAEVFLQEFEKAN